MKELIKLSNTKIENQYEPKNYKITIAEAAKIILESNVETTGVRYKLGAVADRLAISLNYLQIIFKSETGEPLSQLKTRIIVEKAKRLMREGKMPKETSDLCGFENLPAFYRFFKRETQMTPKDYIQSQTNETHNDSIDT
nr:helix-turn-helix transcriptional regulator [Sphingobacterium shayense]